MNSPLVMRIPSGWLASIWTEALTYRHKEGAGQREKGRGGEGRGGKGRGRGRSGREGRGGEGRGEGREGRDCHIPTGRLACTWY